MGERWSNFLESNHKEGEPHGLTTTYRDGYIWYESDYVDGQKVKYTHFKNGLKEYEVNYENEKQHDNNKHNHHKQLKNYFYEIWKGNNETSISSSMSKNKLLNNLSSTKVITACMSQHS